MNKACKSWLFYYPQVTALQERKTFYFTEKVVDLLRRI